MLLSGHHFVGAERSIAGRHEWRAIDPRTGERLEPAYQDATDVEIDRALSLAADAHESLRSRGGGVSREVRAAFLEQIAQEILDLGDPLIDRAMAETGLPASRLVGERGRTISQLQLFADEVREGSYLGVRIDRGDPDREPLPKPDLRRLRIPLGPVVVFGAANFPLAFSVAGGDTASALAAGCPVVVKAHPRHPGTSELTAIAVARAVERIGMPEGTFSLLQGESPVVGAALVRHPLAAAVGFTGSLRGGRALFDIASRRSRPIPVYAEMGSSNPVFLLPEALAAGGERIAAGLAGSVTLGAGQFCTRPGLVFALETPKLESFESALASLFETEAEGTLLHLGIRQGFEEGISSALATGGVDLRARGAEGASGPCGAMPTLLATDSGTFRAHPELQEEIFGPSTLLVRCADAGDMLDLARRLEGQLTATLHAAEEDEATARDLLPILEERAGRVLFGGFPTGVEVGHAMQHGGPYPATTAAASTSVGSASIQRWLRPVVYQNAPESLLPEELRDDNPAGLMRRIDGKWTPPEG
ncbi:MAG: aldehyde dehydrogenase (NADP(+)) [Acidobacteriota bacterium]